MVLEKFKKDSSNNIDGYIGVRLPKQMELDFKKICKDNNIRVAEALRILIAAEIEAAADVAASAPVAAPAAVNPVQNGKSVPGEKPRYKEPGAGEIAVKDFTLVNESGGKILPCPVCDKWLSYATFKRHLTGQHEAADTLEFLLEHKYKARQMVKEKTLEE